MDSTRDTRILNQKKGEVIMLLDDEGNLSVAGKIKQGLEQKVN